MLGKIPQAGSQQDSHDESRFMRLHWVHVVSSHVMVLMAVKTVRCCDDTQQKFQRTKDIEAPEEGDKTQHQGPQGSDKTGLFWSRCRTCVLELSQKDVEGRPHGPHGGHNLVPIWTT